MAEIVLENEVTEVRCLRVFPEFNVNEGLSWSLSLCLLFRRNRAVSCHDCELIVLLEVSKNAHTAIGS